MKDLISKTGVLETYAELYDTFEDNQFIRKELNKVYDKLNGLPYAQPEPQEDAVSRKDVIDLYKRGAEIIAKAKGISVEDMPHNGLDALMNLPSVTPKRKTGKWLDNYQYGYKCSECGAYLEIDCGDVEMNFCPNCNADMRGEQDE